MKAILVKNLVLFVSFFVIYSIYFNVKPSDWNGLENNPNDFINAMYFSIATHSTTGYGDINPTTSVGKVITSIHMLLAFLINIL
jgi:hypothetical protein